MVTTAVPLQAASPHAIASSAASTLIGELE
jgi:hypothetical protein